MANIEKLRAVLAKIKADPKSWDQTKWICGTAACFAGHAVLMEGATPGPPEESVLKYWPNSGTTRCETPSGGLRQVSELAKEILDLTSCQGDCLFEAENELIDLEKMVDALEEDDGDNLEWLIEERDERLEERRALEYDPDDGPE
jgi:hypothetical protein